ncbi:hypothetical protein B0H15DRAFT_945372 [Mycena belliarum]|uniref:Uncharacterized protein n=1 Tax=Mycena belliarum TaxID=1033014 RepID=A0AAD6UDK6_9AGAR|nr:hypothetical protein B0H15DRAFT_945372 [Mycena belliae]
MPSLRRSLSSPSVRPSPYPAQPSPLSGAGTRTHGGSGHRRSSGSETSTRRVLADIEWWRVADGQRDVVPEQESEEVDPEQEDDLPDGVQDVPVPAGTVGAARSSPTAHWVPLFPGLPEIPVVEMAALSIAPTTPRRHAPESSSSSLESTPEAADVQAEHPHLDIGALSFGVQDTDVPSPSASRARSSTSPSLSSVRSHSFADFASYECQYADFGMSPLSSSPFFSN